MGRAMAAWGLALAFAAQATQAAPATPDTELAVQAKEAWTQRNRKRLAELAETARSQGHALAGWVEYFDLNARLAEVRQPEMDAFYARYAGSYVEDRLRNDWLGVYWPLAGEFDPGLPAVPRALPFARRSPAEMVFRRWDGAAPTAQDECGIATSTGAVAVPDVVLVPCVGFTREGFRLGYGGGYFDRWLAAHPGVTTIGVAWSAGEAAFPVEPHDQALTLILTERELIAP